MEQSPKEKTVVAIKTALMLQSIKQKQVADATGVSPAMVSLYIRGMAVSARLDKWFEETIGVSHAEGADN